MKELEEALGYIFKNKALLKQALTRESAIQEKLPLAAKQSYQTLEFVGDAALKHGISRLLFDKLQGHYTEGELHECAKKLIANETVLPQIAECIHLASFIIKGKGEATVTAKMKADMLEAILGAISLDNPSQEILFYVIERLWEPYLKQVLIEAEKAKRTALKTPVLNTAIPPAIKKKPFPKNEQQAIPSLKAVESSKDVHASLSNRSVERIIITAPVPILSPPSPRTQRMFTGLGGSVSSETFEHVVANVPNVNCNNIGKVGDTALMMLLRNEKLRESKEIPKMATLLKHGALWTAKNNRGETADDLAKQHDPQVITRLKALSLKP